MNVPSRSRFIHQVDIYLPETEAVDSTGSLRPMPEPIDTAVTCLVMDHGGGRFPNFGRELERKKVRVLFPDPITLRQGHYLKFTTAAGYARTFLVDSSRDDQDMGRLWVAECQEQPDPTEGQ